MLCTDQSWKAGGGLLELRGTRISEYEMQPLQRCRSQDPHASLWTLWRVWAGKGHGLAGFRLFELAELAVVGAKFPARFLADIAQPA